MYSFVVAYGHRSDTRHNPKTDRNLRPAPKLICLVCKEVWKLGNLCRLGCTRFFAKLSIGYYLYSICTLIPISRRTCRACKCANTLPSSPFVSWTSVFCCFCWLIWFCRVATTSGITASMSDNDSTILCSVPSSPIEISASVYCNPFWSMDKSAAGGTRAPLILLCDMCDSMPNVYAECWKPARETHVQRRENESEREKEKSEIIDIGVSVLRRIESDREDHPECEVSTAKPCERASRTRLLYIAHHFRLRYRILIRFGSLGYRALIDG